VEREKSKKKPNREGLGFLHQHKTLNFKEK